VKRCPQGHAGPDKRSNDARGDPCVRLAPDKLTHHMPHVAQFPFPHLRNRPELVHLPLNQQCGDRLGVASRKYRKYRMHVRHRIQNGRRINFRPHDEPRRRNQQSVRPNGRGRTNMHRHTIAALRDRRIRNAIRPRAHPVPRGRGGHPVSGGWGGHPVSGGCGGRTIVHRQSVAVRGRRIRTPIGPRAHPVSGGCSGHLPAMIMSAHDRSIDRLRKAV
jgi:hypothetical protein